MKSIALWVNLTLSLTLSGCAIGGSKGGGPWVGQSVDAVAAHPLFRTLPMIRTINSAGVEIRNYQHHANTSQCYSEAGVKAGDFLSYGTYTATVACTGKSAGCDHVFSVRDAKVVEYAAAGRLLDACSAAAPRP